MPERYDDYGNVVRKGAAVGHGPAPRRPPPRRPEKSKPDEHACIPQCRDFGCQDPTNPDCAHSPDQGSIKSV